MNSASSSASLHTPTIIYGRKDLGNSIVCRKVALSSLRRPPRLDLSIIVGPKNLSPMERILLERRLLQVLDS